VTPICFPLAYFRHLTPRTAFAWRIDFQNGCLPHRRIRVTKLPYPSGDVGLGDCPPTATRRIHPHLRGRHPCSFDRNWFLCLDYLLIQYNEGGINEGVKVPGSPKETRGFAGRRILLEPAIAGDGVFIRAWNIDEAGNCVFVWALCITLEVFPLKFVRQIVHFVIPRPRTRDRPFLGVLPFF